MAKDKHADELRAFSKRIEDMFIEEFYEKPGFVIAFTFQSRYKETVGSSVHWVTNVVRDDAILILKATANKLIGQLN